METRHPKTSLPIFISMLLVASFLVLIVSAQPEAPPAGGNKTALLDSALKDMQCKVTFETDLMNAIIDLFPSLSDSLEPHIEELQSDVEKLEQYADRQDVQNYSIYVQEVFTPHLMEATVAQREGLESLRDDPTLDRNETKEKMQSLRSIAESLSEEQDECFDAEAHANLVLNYYNSSLNSYWKRADNLRNRSINADLLYNLVTEARQKILTPLRNEVKEAENTSQIREALGKYCLYDGCLNGTNYHMAAKFETTRLSILLNNVIFPEAANLDLDNNGYFDRDEIKIKLEHADEMIESWSDMNADGNQLKNVWENIRSAAKGMHDIFVELKGGGGEQ